VATLLESLLIAAAVPMPWLCESMQLVAEAARAAWSPSAASHRGESRAELAVVYYIACVYTLAVVLSSILLELRKRIAHAAGCHQVCILVYVLNLVY
jgi:hypothetical protein